MNRWREGIPRALTWVDLDPEDEDPVLEGVSLRYYRPPRLCFPDGSRGRPPDRWSTLPPQGPLVWKRLCQTAAAASYFCYLQVVLEPEEPGWMELIGLELTDQDDLDHFRMVWPDLVAGTRMGVLANALTGLRLRITEFRYHMIDFKPHQFALTVAYGLRDLLSPAR